MNTLVFVLHVISCLMLIGLILIQRGQGSDMGAAFGGASQTVFGSRGPATFLNKITIIVAVVFLAASLYLAQVAKKGTTTSIVDQAQKLEQKESVIEKEVDKPIEGTLETKKVEDKKKDGEKKDK